MADGESGRFRGSRGSAQRLTEIEIPTAEYVLPFFVEDAGPDLQQQVRSSLHPVHLLLLGAYLPLG